MDSETIITLTILGISTLISVLLLFRREYTQKRPRDKEKNVENKEEIKEETEEREGINIGRIVSKVITMVLALYVGSVVLQNLGSAMNGTTSEYNNALSLIGWTINEQGTITSTNNYGVLIAIAIIGFFSIVLEFLPIMEDEE